MHRKTFSILLLFFPLMLFPQTTARDYYDRAQEFFLQEDYYAAIDQYKNALSVNPRFLEAILGQAQSYYLLGEYQEAGTILNEAQPLGTKDPGAMNIRARILLSQGELTQAQSLLSDVLRLEPNNPMARLGLGELMVQRGAYNQALAHYLEFLADFPEDYKANLSALYLMDELREEAALEDLLLRALSYHSFDSRLNQFAGEFYLRKENYNRALSFAQTFTTQSRQKGQGYALQGRIYLGRGEATLALGILDQALRQLPNDPELYFLSGMAHVESGNINQAITSFRQALRLSPQQEIYRIAMEDVAQRFWPLENSGRSEMGEYHFRKARAWRMANQFLPALASYQRGFRLWPFHRDARLEYARMLSLRGYLTSFLADLQVLQEEFPQFQDQPFLDDLSIHASLYQDRFPSAWGLSAQQTRSPALGSPKYKIALFLESGESRVPFYQGPELLQHYLIQGLENPRRWDLFDGDVVSSQTQAFRAAREAGVDFFLLTRFRLGDRDFGLQAQLFLASSGRPLATWEIHRSGMDRISLGVGEIARRMDQFFPQMGKVVDRKGNRLLIDLGLRDGLELDQELSLVRENTLRFSITPAFFSEDPANFLGNLTISELDDWVALGIYEQSGFFDLLRPGDWVIVPREEAPEAQSAGLRFPNDLQRKIITIPNRPSRSN